VGGWHRRMESNFHKKRSAVSFQLSADFGWPLIAER
jgi:hypothetical protein